VIVLASFDKAFSKIVFERREEGWSHVPYYTELDLLEIIKNGEPERIAGRVRDMFPVHSGHLSADPHRQAIYEFVACITLVTRFAVEGGVQTERAYTLSDEYIRRADNTKNVHGVYALYEKMLLDFVTKVKHAKRAKKPLSLPVVRATEYIDSHLHTKILLKDIAAAVGRNASYLCVLFKEETGVALSTYINREKIEEAKHLLRDTDMMISEISATLAFGSQSYFAKLFQEFTGETPKVFRAKKVVEHR
jgi:YesN/AraC family two-component response regulator